MKIVVLGSTGMLGSAVTQYLCEHYGPDSIWSSYRSSSEDLPNQGGHTFLFDALRSPGDINMLDGADVVINCIGVIKPFVEKVGMLGTIMLNSVLPHLLAQYCQAQQIKLIHITTDCVYSGAKGNYIETDFHDCDDTYGKSKSLGEPSANAMVLRTSIIGPEIHNFCSLVSWVRSQANKTINGFTNHRWNGITTRTYGQVVASIIDKGLYQTGLFHVFSPADVTKYNLVRMLSDRYDLGIQVTPIEASVAVDRTLRTTSNLSDKLQIPYLEQQIAEM